MSCFRPSKAIFFCNFHSTSNQFSTDCLKLIFSRRTKVLGFMYFWPRCVSFGIFSSLSRDQTVFGVIEVQNPNHWTTGEVLQWLFKTVKCSLHVRVITDTYNRCLQISLSSRSLLSLNHSNGISWYLPSSARNTMKRLWNQISAG